eukprot:12067762-Ditylum_brightwellii.AAC.1
MGKVFSTPPHMGSPRMRRPADRAAPSCQDNNKEKWEVVTPVHTCLFGNEMALSSESDGAEERYSFLDEQNTVEFGLNDCCTWHICGIKQFFKELHPAPAGTGIVSIGGFSLPEGIGILVPPKIKYLSINGQKNIITTVESHPEGDILSSYETITRIRSLFPTQCIAEYQSCRKMREAQRSLTNSYKTATPACTAKYTC